MPTKVVIRNQVRMASRDSHRRPMSQPTVVGGEVIDPIIRPDSIDSPFRAGLPYYDQDDGLEYRVVRSGALDFIGGWRTFAFWAERWNITWAQALLLVEKGWLDAAMEEQSAIKRFRCRDEARVLAWIESTTEQKRDKRVSQARRKSERRRR